MKFYQNQAWLTRRYRVQKLTVQQIADECKVSSQTIQNYLEKFKLIRNPRTWTRGK
jgi:predicted DNA-binding transcriptional regulator YafY